MLLSMMKAGESSSARDVVVLEAGRGFRGYWTDLWAYRELFFFLAWRDILVRYKQTAIGLAWAVIRPLLTLGVFTVVFGRIAGLPSGDLPYAVMVCAAILPWQLLSNALSEASNSMLANSNLITKVYFPRLIIPASSIMSSVVDFLVASTLLVALMSYYGIVPSLRVLALPLFVLMAIATALGYGALFTALTVRYRDFRYVIPFVVSLGLYVSPVGFSSEIIPAQWRPLYSVNPSVAIIDGFRWSLLDNAQMYWPGFFISLGSIVAGCAIGIHYFRRTERSFADVI
jgi:lipopolysaccharide transport system permease protein